MTNKMSLFVPYEYNVVANIGNETIESTNSIDFLGIKIDSKLNFSEQVSILCKKGNQKLHTLARMSKYLSEHK